MSNIEIKSATDPEEELLAKIAVCLHSIDREGAITLLRDYGAELYKWGYEQAIEDRIKEDRGSAYERDINM